MRTRFHSRTIRKAARWRGDYAIAVAPLFILNKYLLLVIVYSRKFSKMLVVVSQSRCEIHLKFVTAVVAGHRPQE